MAVTLSHGASRCQRGWGWWPLPEQPGAQLEVRDPKKKERMDVGSLLGVVSAAGVTCTWVMDTEGTAETGDREEGPGQALRSPTRSAFGEMVVKKQTEKERPKRRGEPEVIWAPEATGSQHFKAEGEAALSSAAGGSGEMSFSTKLGNGGWRESTKRGLQMLVPAELDGAGRPFELFCFGRRLNVSIRPDKITQRS